MSTKPFHVEKIDGYRGVCILSDDGVDIEFRLWTGNGWQLSGAEIDSELLRMIRDACEDALNHINQQQPDQQNEQ